MSIYSKETKKKTKTKKEPSKKTKSQPKVDVPSTEITTASEGVTITLTPEQLEALQTNDANEAAQQQVNPMVIPDFFNNIRNNYFVGNRIIWLTDDIMWENAIDVMKRISFYDDGSNEPIYIYISSPGGMCDAGWALVDMIEKVKEKGIVVNTICAGSCSSMAAVILSAGSKGHRFAFPSSRIMIHQAGFGMFGPGGKLDEIANEVKELQYWTDLTIKYFAKVTKKKTADIQKALCYDNYMSPEDAKKFGLIDKVEVVLV